jgi:hypothetical protein
VGRVSKIQGKGKLDWWFELNDCTGTTLLRKIALKFTPIESVEERIAREESEDLDDLPVNPPPWDDNIYMRVFGKVKVEGDGVHCINVINMQPITNFNEITTHSLECIYETLSDFKQIN